MPPLYFAGQHGPMLHAAGRISMAWRIALLAGELNKRRGKLLHVRAGRPIPWAGMATTPRPLSPCASCADGSMRARGQHLGHNLLGPTASGVAQKPCWTAHSRSFNLIVLPAIATSATMLGTGVQRLEGPLS